MKSKSFRVIAALFLFLPLSQPLYAETQSAPTSDAAVAPKPWLYEGSDIPVDSSWTFGELDNGLRYAVKRNDVPASQVSIRVRIDAGALYENDDEQGFAHLIEHLSFRGSTFVPDGEAKRIWQRFGVSFGSDSNAQTTATQTVYKLDLPAATPETLDESMKIISGMMRAPRISEESLNAERAIVLAELREGASAQTKLGDAMRALFFQGQRLANRTTIGTPETLKAATAQNLAAFHTRWYRPENAVIVMAGDLDPEILAAQIKKHFSGWQGKGPLTPEPDFGKPQPSDVVAEVVAEPTLRTEVNIAYLRPWEKVDDTIVYNEQLLVNALAQQIVNRRLENAARQGGSFLFASVNQDDFARSADMTVVTISPLGGDWATAIGDVRGIIADAVKTPPSTADIERETKLFANALRTRVDSYPFEAASKQVDDIVSAVDIRETIAAPKTVIDVFGSMQSKLTPTRILDATRNLFDADQVRIMLSAPKADADTRTKLATALSGRVKASENVRLAVATLGLDKLPKLGKPGKLESKELIERFDLERLLLSNGVRVLLSPNKAESGQIRLVVRFGKGLQSVTPKAVNQFWAGDFVIPENGIGELTSSQIDQMIIGRRIELSFRTDDDAFEFSSATRAEDLADQLRLIATKLEYPGWDAAPVARAKALAKQGYDSFETSAMTVLQRDLQYLLSDKDTRWMSPDPKLISALTPKSFKEFWQPLLASGPIEVAIFGDFDRNAAVEALKNSFGAMKPRKNDAVSPQALVHNFPASNGSVNILTHKGPADQAAAIVAWPTGGGMKNIAESRQLEILAAVFRDRLFEKFRSEQAVSYSPDMRNDWPESFDEGGYLMAYSQIKPQDADRFLKFADEVAANLVEKPVSADELQRAIEPVKQMIERASSGNSFWLNQLKGASYRPERVTALRHLLSDYTSADASKLQALAAKYFRQDKAWKLKVMPAGNSSR